jgi:outer membrane immunogenic protein
MKYNLASIGAAAGVALLLGLPFGASALAADLGAPAPAPYYTKAPPIVAPYNTWTGFYLGGNAGYGWGHSSLNGSTCSPAGTAICFVNAQADAEVGAAYPGNVSPNSFLGGFQAGYNYQWQSLVAGVEGDYTFLNAKATRNTSIVCCGGADNVLPLTQTVQDNWLATFRGRLGFAPTNNFLIYGTGGLAVGNVKYASNFNFAAADGPGSGESGSVSTTKTGYAAGAGVQYALDRHWDLRAEYLYANLGHVNLNTVNPLFLPDVQPTSQSASFNINIIRAGVDYRF